MIAFILGPGASWINTVNHVFWATVVQWQRIAETKTIR